jgi:membrane-bound metal-dependent hydrolase YbcI (DUF457 family)
MNKHSIIATLLIVIGLTLAWSWSIVKSSIIADGMLGIGIMSTLIVLAKYDTKTQKNHGKQND